MPSAAQKRQLPVPPWCVTEIGTTAGTKQTARAAAAKRSPHVGTFAVLHQNQTNHAQSAANIWTVSKYGQYNSHYNTPKFIAIFTPQFGLQR
jgi:hypothetical protein